MNTRYFLPALGFLGLSGTVGAQEPTGIRDTASMSPQVAAAVKRLTEAKILVGYPDGRFLPNKTLTRGELALLLARLWKQTNQFSSAPQKSTVDVLLAVFSPEQPGKAAFADLAVCQWYRPADELIWDTGMMKGYPDGYSRRRRTATRAEATTALARLVRRSKTPLSLNIERVRYADMDGGEWYFGSVLISAGTGLMQSYPDRTFRPHRTVTRGEFAVALARLLPEK